MRAATLVVLLFISSVIIAQTTHNVPSQFATIQAAITASANGDIVLVAPGTYNGAINFLGKAITVASSGGPAATTIVGTAAGRVVTFATNESSASTLQGFTITGGAGGIRCLRSSPRILNCVITGMTLATTFANGGGTGAHVVADTAFSNASPIFDGCTFSNNILSGGGRGGGILVETNSGSSTTTITNCRFLNNFVLGGPGSGGGGGGGGGVSIGRNGGGTLSPTITSCIFEGNTAITGGGLQVDSASTVNISSCRFVGNTAYFVGGSGQGLGGGALLFFATFNVTNCTFTENTALSAAVAYVLTPGTSANFQSCTFAGSVSPTSGGLVAVGSGQLNVRSCIFWDIAPPMITTDGMPVVNVTYSNASGPIFGGDSTNISADPHFVDPANGDYHIAANSPCVDAGSVGLIPIPATDLDGTARIVGTIDIGADEVPPLALPGSNDDLELYVRLNGDGDPLASTHAAPAGTTVTFTMKSPGGTLNGAVPLLAGEFFMPAFPPMGLVSYPYVHLDNGLAFLIAGSFGASPFASPGLEPAGISITTLVPIGLGGFGIRLQGLAVTPFASNGLFAASNAHDILF